MIHAGVRHYTAMKKTKTKKMRRGESGEEVRDHTDVEVPSDAPTPSEQDSDESAAGVEPEAEASPETAVAVDPVQELREKVERLEDGLLRAKADYQNAQRRSCIERAEAIRYANADVMKSLLSVLDDFDRPLAAGEGSEDRAALLEGVRMMYGNLNKALQDHGLAAISARHEPFDPSIHEAVMQQPSEDFPTGTVIEEVARGYRLHDRVLRASWMPLVFATP